jgi:hypothetical protein
MATVLLMFVGTWVVGGSVFWGVLRYTRGMPRRQRIAIGSLLCAITFTPSAMFGHGLYIVPAILVPFVGPQGVPLGTGYLWQVVLPIAVVWVVVALAWLDRTRDTA